MKFFKTLALGAMAVFAFGALAQASTVTFRITGSSAFRGQTHTAIMHILGAADGLNFTDGTSTYGYVGTSGLSKANAAIFNGTLTISGTPTSVTIKTAWSGSEAGISAVAYNNGAGLAVNFLNDGTTASAGGSNGATDPTASGAAAQDLHVADACMSDTKQSTSAFAGGNTINGITYATLAGANSSSIGVTYFAFYTTKTGKADGISNITAQQALTLYKVGKLPLPFLVPGTPNTTAVVYAFGRDPDSGTRLTTMGEIGDGNLGSVIEYYPYDSTSTLIDGSTTHVTWAYVKAVPASTVNTIAYSAGNGGYHSGGNLCKALDGDDASFKLNSTTGTAQPTGSCGITYASIGDGANLGGDLGQILTFNGVDANDTNVANGKYPLWTYEHMYVSPNAGASQLSVANQVATQLQTTDAAGGGALKLSSMLVQRAGDGGTQIINGNAANGNGN